MTVIALIAEQSDPHIISDTLLSAEGSDPSPQKKVWLPALGLIDSEWKTNGSVWHIARLGRKSFILPNNSGLLTFAGDCRTAFKFWSELSDVFLARMGYKPDYRINSQTVLSVLTRIQDRDKISVLGILLDEQGGRTPFIHNPAKELNTKNFGTCWIAGSGTKLVEDIILSIDAETSQRIRKNKSLPRKPAENLAEHIASHMMYRESDQYNGHSSGSPIAAQCGGFFEWYPVDKDGIRPLKSRLDIHFSEENGKLFATRMYFSEQIQTIEQFGSAYPAPRYYISVLNLIADPVEVRIDAGHNDWNFHPPECYGVAIESTFTLYDNPTDNETEKRISGIVSTAMQKKLFETPLKINRVRIVVGANKKAIERGFISTEGGASYAQISYTDSVLNVRIGSSIISAATDIAQRLNAELSQT